MAGKIQSRSQGCLLEQSKYILAGDFNLPQIPWNLPETAKGSLILASSNFSMTIFVQFINTAPRKDDILDLVITNTPDPV